MATARSMDPPLPSMERATTARPRFRRAKPITADENGTQQCVPPYGSQGAPRVNTDVRIMEIIMLTARTLDLPPLTTQRARASQKRFRTGPGHEQP